MSLNGTPQSERVHIGFFGRRNTGKSSLVNAVTAQSLSVVSDVKGTTTDMVIKSMELLPLGPVAIIDTPGFDDEGELGELRVRQSYRALERTDVIVLVTDSAEMLTEDEREFLKEAEKREIPYIVVRSKSDLRTGKPQDKLDTDNELWVSAVTGEGIDALKSRLSLIIPDLDKKRLIGDLVTRGQRVILVCPIDESAPKDRLILPQQMAIRDILDSGALPVICRDTELGDALDALKEKPAMVITDSQAFEAVGKLTPDDIPLTSFSILMARYRGFLKTAIKGVEAIEALKDNSRVLIAEGCTHHRQCNDIGTVKIPNWLKKHTGRELIIESVSGHDFPEDLSPYSVVIHCGGCMLNEKEVKSRMKRAEEQGVPFTNYGIVISRIKGTLDRSIAPFGGELL